MESLTLDLINQKTGTYFDSCINEYVMVLGDKIVGGYKPTGDKELDKEIDRMMWSKIIAPNNCFNLTLRAG
jgi:hypothetical protein